MNKNSIINLDFLHQLTEGDAAFEKELIHLFMKAVESNLPSKDFMRIHRSYIVCLDKIKEIEENTISIEGKLLPVSRSNKDNFLKKINLL